ncbi:MAG: Gfo/Idh/MocA family oxidoreductase [Acidobacteria bacterium]|nr:Gfo/Idh/MocA family oxidoreductase [Acidobacteriota bacterium]
MNFAVTGVSGFVAPRHLNAIRATGNRLIAAMDPHDAAGVLDAYSYDVRFFTEFERFDRHLEKLRRGPEADRVHYLTVCSPNYLHDAHVRLALRVGADVICEKPLVINPWNLDALQELEIETGRRVWTVLQLRLSETLLALRRRLASGGSRVHHDVCLTYIAPRGRWYDVSWKGIPDRSGGLATNIGVHLFDLLLWLFGPVERVEVHVSTARRLAGLLECGSAAVRWFLSAEPSDLPLPAERGGKAHRSLTVDGEQVEFSGGFDDLHTKVYEAALGGAGFGIDEARPSIELAYRIRQTAVAARTRRVHPLAAALA